eukprot:3963187-Amphidinium_carterae.1
MVRRRSWDRASWVWMMHRKAAGLQQAPLLGLVVFVALPSGSDCRKVGAIMTSNPLVWTRVPKRFSSQWKSHRSIFVETSSAILCDTFSSLGAVTTALVSHQHESLHAVSCIVPLQFVRQIKSELEPPPPGIETLGRCVRSRTRRKILCFAFLAESVLLCSPAPTMMSTLTFIQNHSRLAKSAGKDLWSVNTTNLFRDCVCRFQSWLLLVVLPGHEHKGLFNIPPQEETRPNDRWKAPLT